MCVSKKLEGSYVWSKNLRKLHLPFQDKKNKIFMLIKKGFP
jgi:hypothetical protein